jgi:lipoprotein-releasing system ATP-binding protein
MIIASNIKHYYERDVVIKGISLEIKRGNFVSLIGESGSGKSTILSILSTLLKPKEGEIEIFGNELKDIKNVDSFRRKNIGFIFQFHYLINYLSLKENILLAADKQNHKDLDELLDSLGIKDIEDKYPNEISGGQRQRASIARALINKPKVVFADEPTGNLDSKNSLKVSNLLKDVSNKGTTVVVATHDSKLANISDFIYEVNDGRISKYS